MILHRKLRILFGLASALLFCVPLVFWLSKSQKSSDFTPPLLSRSKYPAPRQSMQGFHFTSVQDGVTILSVAADNFRIEKKKVGFLRFGMVDEARLYDAHFRLYGYSPDEPLPTNLQTLKGRSPSGEKASLKPLPTQTDPGKTHPGTTPFALRDIFARQAMPAALTSKNLAFISARPVSIEICDQDKVVTRFTAENGGFNLRQRTIQLSGNVQVQSGDRVLRTSELAINPSLALIKARGDFDFSFPDGQTRGRGIITDIMLKPKRMMHK